MSFGVLNPVPAWKSLCSALFLKHSVQNVMLIEAQGILS